MLNKYSKFLVILILFQWGIPSLQISAQIVRAVDDTIDLYPGVPKTVDLLANDTVPFGDSIKVMGGSANNQLITSTYIFKGFFTFLVQPYWGFNGNLAGNYTLIDYTLGKTSSANILFRIHDHSFDSLDINNLNAGITAYGNEFSFFGAGKSLFCIPKNSQKSTLYTFSLWIGGKGIDSTLYLAAERYRQGQSGGNWGIHPDFHAGPVMDSVNYSIYQDTLWSRTWKIRKTEIEYHKTHWNNPGYIIPENIRSWPGNGNTNAGQAARLAPYHDRNNDGIYTAADGDYPVIRGDEAVYVIFNDDRDIHKETNGNKMKAEIHLMAYAFDLPDDSAFNNTIFFNYKIYNRSSKTYFNTYVGAFADFDIGYFLDDYIGCDVERSSIIGYNGLSVDGFGQPQAYGAHPPAQSVTILGGPFLDPAAQDRPRLDNTGHQLCNESVNGTGFGDGIAGNERYGLTNFLAYKSNQGFGYTYTSDPIPANIYYQNMNSVWYDSTHLFYGGKGHPDYGGYGPDCRYLYPGKSDSLNWGTGCQVPDGDVNWTAENSGILPDDIRGTGSMGPFTFHPGDVQDVDIAFVFARDYTGQDTLEPSVAKLRQMIDIVRNSYNTGLLPDGNSFFGINEKSKSSSSTMKIYPNPAKESVNILFDRPVNEAVNIRIMNTNGMEVYSSRVIPAEKKIQLDVSGLSSGMYIVSIQTKDFINKEKVIILK